MPPLNGLHHVKLPVSDVVRSRDWYRDVLGMVVDIEFVEDGALRGVALRDPGETVCIALRHDPDRAAALVGFDPVALGVPTRADVEQWQRRFDDLGQPHGGVVEGHQGWVLVGVRDPDGLEVRLYTLQRHDGRTPA